MNFSLELICEKTKKNKPKEKENIKQNKQNKPNIF